MSHSPQHWVCFTGCLFNSNETSARRRRKHCALAVVRRSQIFRPAAEPLPGGAGRPKFNQLETVTTFTYTTQFGEDRCTQFRITVITDPQTHKHTQTHRQDRLQYTAPQLACSVIKGDCWTLTEVCSYHLLFIFHFLFTFSTTCIIFYRKKHTKRKYIQQF